MIKKLTKYAAVFLAAFAVAGSAGYLGVSLFTRSAPEIILPDLTGKNIIDVLEILTRLGLNPKLHGTQFHTTIPKYGVSRQDPQPGAIIKTGRDVILYISKGSRQVRMPDLRHLSLTQGLIRLEGMEIVTGRIVHVHSDRSPKGNIISQVPLPNARIQAGGQADILVSKGPAPVHLVMPALVGNSMTDALEELAGLSLAPGQISSVHDGRRPEDVVLAQEPVPGSRIPITLPVRLKINRPGKERVMNKDNLNKSVLISFKVPFGFSNRHVRVTTDMFGRETFLYDTHMKPGKMINLLIPAGIKTKIRIFIDHKLVQDHDLGPWQGSTAPWTFIPNTGEYAWE